MMLLAWLLACPRAAPEAEPALVDTSRGAARVEPAGIVTAGVWEDAEFPYVLRVPEGYEITPGLRGQNPRVTLVDPSTRARVELSVYPGGPRGPRERRGCAWTFVDTARYRQLALAADVTIGTCTPADPRHARVLGYFVEHAGSAYDLEAIIPPGKLIDGKAAAERAVGGVRFR